ncbi:MAG: hypothetical protein ACYTFG_19460 [Planctomycetota bacterium]|jgi:hypothetical protein
MKNFTLALMAVAALFLVIGCGGAKEGEGDKKEGGEAKEEAKALSPTDTVKGFFDSFKGGKDWKKAKTFCSKKTGQFFDMLLEEEPEEGPDIVKYEVLAEEIDGEKASVKVTTTTKRKSGSEKTKEEFVLLKKEDGAWKIHGIGDEKGKEEDFEKAFDEMKKMKEEAGGSEGK